MARCPHCHVSSQDDPEAMEITQEDPFAWEITGGHMGGLDGSQPVLTVAPRLKLSCLRCGWSILGIIEDTHFSGDPDTQVFPTTKEAHYQ